MQDYRVEVDKVNKAEWSNLLPEFTDSTIYQTWSYGAVRWGENKLSHIVVKKNNEPAGMAQLVIKKIPVIGTGIAYLPWGPLWQRMGKTNSNEDLKNIIEAIKEEYMMRRGLLLRIAPNLIVTNKENNHSIFEQQGFQLNNTVQPYRTLILDLEPTLQELRKGLDQKWRNQLNRSEKNGLKIIESSSNELFAIFLKLQKEMQSRKQYEPGVDYDEFRRIQKDLPQHFKMRILICEFEGNPVTATIVSAIGDTGIYLLGANGDKGLNLKGAYISQWLIIHWLKERGCKWYDLGGINPENNPGVYHFKVGMSGLDVSHIGQYEASSNAISTLAVSFAEKIRDLKRSGKGPS